MGRPLTLLLGLVPVVGLVELALHGHFARVAPDFEAYAALAPELKKLKQPGIPVVVAPRWAEPLVRQAAPEVFPLVELARPDDTGFAAFLEVSALGQAAPELAGFEVRSTQRHGPFTLTLRSNPRPEPVRFDFVSAVEAGEVEVFAVSAPEHSSCQRVERSRATTGGLHGPAARPSVRHECPGGRVVGVTLIEDEAYRPRRCILVDPLESGDVVLRFTSVPASARLVGFVGFSYFLTRDGSGVSVELHISDAERELGQHRVVADGRWSRFELTRSAPFGSVEVLVKRLKPEPGDFCFALEAR
jgi:hypothetical protein